jgi:hypothetical protein
MGIDELHLIVGTASNGSRDFVAPGTQAHSEEPFCHNKASVLIRHYSLKLRLTDLGKTQRLAKEESKR